MSSTKKSEKKQEKKVQEERKEDRKEEKNFVMSMTRANKVLSKLRENPQKGFPKNRYSYSTGKKYSMEVKVLSFDADTFKEQMNEMREKFNDGLTKKKLIEKWKNRLFALNVRYGIHDIMSDIDILKDERNALNEVVVENNTTHFVSPEQVVSNINTVEKSERKYDLKWDASPFNMSLVKKRIADINKRIGTLEDERDNLNIQNSFSIDLTPKEMEFADLE